MRIVIALLLCVQPALALPPIRDGFAYRYGLENPRAAWQRSLAAQFERAKCTVCHSPKSKSPELMNPYGKFLSARLDKRDFVGDAKMPEREQRILILKALSDAERVPEFRHAIDAGRLP